mgnify:CR=1 FL=1
MGELLKAAVGCIETPSLLPRELKILTQIALLADDTTSPTLTTHGTVRHAVTGRVDSLGGDRLNEWLKRDLIESRLFVFTGTGWLKEVDGPEHDGAYQLNMARLKRLLDLTEVQLATGEHAPEALVEADCEYPGDFDHTPPEDLAEQIDRILVSNPTT